MVCKRLWGLAPPLEPSGCVSFEHKAAYMSAVEEFRELERKAERVVVLDYRLWAWGLEIEEVA